MGTQKSLFDSTIPDTGPIAVCPACGYTGYTLLFEGKTMKCGQCHITIYDQLLTNENDDNIENF